MDFNNGVIIVFLRAYTGRTTIQLPITFKKDYFQAGAIEDFDDNSVQGLSIYRVDLSHVGVLHTFDRTVYSTYTSVICIGY